MSALLTVINSHRQIKTETSLNPSGWTVIQTREDPEETSSDLKRTPRTGRQVYLQTVLRRAHLWEDSSSPRTDSLSTPVDSP